MGACGEYMMRGCATTAGEKGRNVCVMVLLASLVLSPACAKKAQKDTFVEHWEARAQQSQGYSPRSHPRRIELEKAAIRSTSCHSRPRSSPPRSCPRPG